MGDMTRAQLMAHAGLAAGNENALSFVRTWLDAWLKRTGKSWSWPQLKYRVTVNVASGDSEVVVGSGEEGTTALHLHRLLGQYVFWYTSDKRSRGRMDVRQLLDGNVDKDESATNASDRLGDPDTIKVRVGNGSDKPDGCFRLYPDPVPQRAMIFAFDAHIVVGLGTDTANDNLIPWYPNDKTLLQACKCAIIELDDGGEGNPAFDAQMERLEAMVVADRDFDGEGPGDNQMMALDPGVFR